MGGVAVGTKVKLYGLPGVVKQVAGGGKRLLVEQAGRTVWAKADRVTVVA